MKRFDADIRDFYQKIDKDLQLDIQDWAQENVEKIMSKLFTTSDLSDIASMFGGFDVSGLADMLRGVKQGTATFDPYQILGLKRDATDEEVKTRYKELMTIIHPDKTQGKTNHLASLVNIAYEKICKQRGIN